MSARDRILNALKMNKPAAVPLPDLDTAAINTPDDILETFTRQVQVVGGHVQVLEQEGALYQLISDDRANGQYIINRLPNGGPIDEVPADTMKLASVNRAYLKGSFGVAENGAIWVMESAMGNRILPFICEQLVLVINRQELVANMHAAYAAIQINREGYGVFIAGPSKTADIEQSLVIGAHGPKALTVLIIL